MGQGKTIFALENQTEIHKSFYSEFKQGDYHRLGHGTVDHVRRPKKVAALQGIKIVSIATGSLHCVACDDMGRVFTFGDNDEGEFLS